MSIMVILDLSKSLFYIATLVVASKQLSYNTVFLAGQERGRTAYMAFFLKDVPKEKVEPMGQQEGLHLYHIP